MPYFKHSETSTGHRSAVVEVLLRVVLLRRELIPSSADQQQWALHRAV